MSRIFLFLALVPALCSGVHYKLRAETNSRFYYHTYSPLDVASHRHSLDLDSVFKDGPFWSLVAGFRAYTEGAFASNESRYGADLRQRESQDLRLKDTYLQYRSGGWTLRAGSQQIIWGEAFGFYYADFVNPKDLRELGIGPLDKNRISIPMLSAKYVVRDYSFHGFFVPKPYFHLMPAEGGDFSFPFLRFFPGMTIQHSAPPSLALVPENFEGGLKVGGLLGKWDLSLLYASYFDRSPIYTSIATSATSVEIRDSHQRLNTVGATSSVPCGSFICRAEVLWHRGKYFNTFQAPDLIPMKSDELVAVLGVDYMESDRNYLGLQIAENLRLQELDNPISSKSQQNISLHVKMATFSGQKVETILSFLPNDQSVLLQAWYLVPISDRFELILSGDTFFGEPNTQFGQYKQASRIGTLLKIYLSAEG